MDYNPVIMAYEYVQDNENFRGMSLSNWLGEWLQWLHGATVEYGAQPGEILHTRGGLGYEYIGGIAGAARIQKDTKHTEIVNISENIPVYINILTSFYFIGENHPRGNLETLSEVMSACIDDFARSKVDKATIEKDGGGPVDLERHLVQRNDLNLRVHPTSLLAESFEMPVERGANLMGCAITYMSLIKKLSPGVYKVYTKNTGVRGYQSESDYTINVTTRANMGPF
jgi:hypothetical protein